MDTDLSTLFVKRFGVDSHLSMPNVDAMYIKTLLEEGAYKEACEKLIDYYGENAVCKLNEKICKLKEDLEYADNECDDLRQSNDAEHDEKMKLWNKAEQATRLLKRCSDMIGVPCRLDDVESVRNDVSAFLENNKDLLS